MKGELLSLESKKVKLTYNGHDMPRGEMTPIELEGRIKRVGDLTLTIETDGYPNLELVLEDIDQDSIKTLEPEYANFE